MSRRGHYLGGHSLTFGSSSKDDSEEYWLEAKARVDSVHARGQEASADLRSKLNELEARRLAIRSGLRSGQISLPDGERALARLVEELDILQQAAKVAGVRFDPSNGIARTLILSKDAFYTVEMLCSWGDEADLEDIRLYLD